MYQKWFNTLVSHLIHIEQQKNTHHHLLYITVEKGQNNLAFVALVQLGQAERCVDLLIETGRAPEAALFARTYAPRSVFFFVSPRKKKIHTTYSFIHLLYSKVHDAVISWKTQLQSKNRTKIADAIADPSINPELFEENWAGALQREKEINKSPQMNGKTEDEIKGREEGEEEEEDHEDEEEEEEEEEESGEGE